MLQQQQQRELAPLGIYAQHIRQPRGSKAEQRGVDGDGEVGDAGKDGIPGTERSGAAWRGASPEYQKAG